MTGTEDKLRDYLKLVTADLRRTRQRLRDVEAQDSEPIAIVGMSCRFAGGIETPEQLWQVLVDERDTVGEFPTDRGWELDGFFHDDPDHAGTSYVREAAFLEGASGFDADFFGISPREALAMDPQQRLVLELCWEAVERARLDPHGLRGSDTAVFVGGISMGYGIRGTPPEEVEGQLATGTAASVISGRVSYLLGLRGPALTVDTACSSSLVALHLAAQALRSGEAKLALVGGATVLPNSGLFVEFSRQRGLAVDGRCKSFADAADGVGWGEGGGVLLLERLADAQRNGRKILAVVRGSAVNSDGASSSLTAPNGPSQQRVIQAALESAQLTPEMVDAVDGHGTGTTLGDPIEADALLAVYGQGRPADRPLLLGSVKSNIGHTQAGAGVAGIIKMALAIEHGVVPATLHVDAPTRQVDWGDGQVQLVTESRSWPETDRPRRAGVSSFGISGTNAHVIIEQAPPAEDTPAAEPVVSELPVPWVVSARSLEGLDARIDQLRDLAGDPADISFSLLATRAKFDHRAVILNGRELARGSVTGGGTAYVFSGQGSQRMGMGRELYQRFPAFTEAFDAIIAELGEGVREIMWGEDAAALDETGNAQPALFALEVSLFRLLESWGVRPDRVVGHSIGELAAAHVAGILSLSDACKVVSARASLMQALPAGGAMASLPVPEAEVLPLLDEHVSIAAVNGPAATVVSGTEEAVERLAARFERSRRLRTSHAFHSPLMEPMLAEFAEAIVGITVGKADIPVISTVGPVPDFGSPGYWVRQVREPVRFADAIETLAAVGTARLAELGPDGRLCAAVTEIAPTLAAAPVLRRDRPEVDSAVAGLAALYVTGAPVDWTPWCANGSPVDLPTYPFQRKPYWVICREDGGDASGLGQEAVGHPLLAALVSMADDSGVVFTGRVSVNSQPWLADHVVSARTLFPGTAFLELAGRAGDGVGCDRVEELTMVTPLMLPDRGAVQLQVSVGSDNAGQREIAIHSRPENSVDEPWTLHASGLLASTGHTAEPIDPTWPPEGAEPVDMAVFYPWFTERGFDYGPEFRGVRAVWKRPGEVFAEVALPQAREAEAFGLHPALLDAAVQASSVLGHGVEAPGQMPFSWQGVTLHAAAAAVLRVRISHSGGATMRIQATDTAGDPVISVDALLMRTLPTGDTAGPALDRNSLFELDWSPVTATASGEPVTIVGEDVLELRNRLADAVEVRVADSVAEAGDSAVVSLVGTDEPASALELTSQALDLIQQCLTASAETRLTFVTHGAVTGQDLAAAAVWGLVRAAQSEQPGRFTLIDLDEESTGETLAQALGSDEPQLTVRDNQLSGARLNRVSIPEQPALWSETGTVLITGGLGGLGRLLATHLVTQRGVRDLVLVSRRGPAAPEAAEVIAELIELGAAVRVLACDVSDRAAVADLVAQLPELTAVVHAAGVVDDGLIESQTPERLANALRAKADAAWHLHELTRDRDLTAFVLFSSAAGTVGSAGQGNYSAANAYLDALARHRHGLGLPAVSLAWGVWASETGITAGRSDVDQKRAARGGMPALTDEQGLALFDASLADHRPVLMPARLDLATLRSLGRPPHLLRALIRTSSRRAAGAAAGAAGELAGRLAALPEAERSATLLKLTLTAVAGVLGHGEDVALDPSRNFNDLGFDSLTAVELRNRLGSDTGIRLPATLVFDHPNALKLTEYLLGELLGGAVTPTPQRPSTVVRADEPIAIVGMSCRYPGGVGSPDDLWRVVHEGVDAISEFPDNRGWDMAALFGRDSDLPGTSYVRHGGFLHDAGKFDAELFRMSPREALSTDAQQRLLLEATWEALERAGMDPTSLRGSATAVFAGVMYTDYATLLGADEFEGFRGNGGSAAIASGRVAYTFGLEGPTLTVDTACSSSLVAVHLAGQALRNGECELALAGGVAIMATPGAFVEFSRQGGLSPDGRCRSYSDTADGVAWSEGVGMLVLERLSDARRNGHQVLGLIKGSAVNSDGASNGMSAPNGPAQQRVIRAALASAGLSTSDVDVVEGHGTGTPLGDPIEAEAVVATYGQDREEPLFLGSIKSNLGHTQAAAGVAGIIKMVMAMRHGLLPKTLHLETPSSHVDWQAGEVELLAAETPWPQLDRPRRAAVSSFGISGTNAHVVLEEPPPAPEPAPTQHEGVLPWVLSGQTENSVRALAERLAEAVTELHPADVGLSLAAGRATLPHRAVVIGSDTEELLAGLRALAAGEAGPIIGEAPDAGRAIAFAFPGQGAYWTGMGAQLLEQSPVFAEAMARCAAALAPHLDFSVLDVLRGNPGAPGLDRIDVAQPTMWAVSVSLAELWRAHGVRPSAVLGHSQGEVAAACIAGALSLEDGALVISVRSKAIAEELFGQGSMIAVALPLAQVQPRLADFADRLGIAAVNGPNATVVSGEYAALDELRAILEADGIRVGSVAGDFPAHSAMFDRVHDRVLTALADLQPRTSLDVPMLSTVTGEWIDPAGLTAEYWFRNMRETVQFEPAVRTLLRQGRGLFIEVSPHPVLVPGISGTIDDTGSTAVVVPTLRREDGGLDRVYRSLALANVAGAPVDWTSCYPGAHRVDLPTYAFDQTEFWPTPFRATGDAASVGLSSTDHPLLGGAVTIADTGALMLTGRLSLDAHPWLADHTVGDQVLFAGAGFVELALRAGDELGCAQLADLTLAAPLILPGAGAVTVQVLVEPEEAGRRRVTIHSRGDALDGDWILHASGLLSTEETRAQLGFDATVWPPADAEPVDLTGCYEEFATHGFHYGPAFQRLHALWRHNGDLYAEVTLDTEADGFTLHPALLDASLHTTLVGAAGGNPDTLPFQWDGVTLHATGATALRVRVSQPEAGALTIEAADPAGEPVLTVSALRMRERAAAATRSRADSLYSLGWLPVTSTVDNDPDITLVQITTGDDPRQDAHTETARVLALLQQRIAGGGPRLVFLTRGATTGENPAAAAVWGLVRSAQAESPDAFGLLDLDSTIPAGDLTPADLPTGALDPAEPQLALRDGVLHAARLTRITPAEEPFTWPTEGSVLITGGTSGLGAVIAKHLAEQGVARLVLASRRGADAEGVTELVEELGVPVEVVACDLADQQAVTDLVNGIADLTGVVHSAGVLDDALIPALTPERLATVLRPKVDAAWHLHEATRDRDLAAFVLFSSAGGLLGAPGQANYAAANAFLDALAAHRHTLGLPARSMAWGGWASAGMASRLAEADRARLARTGTPLMSTVDGLALFDLALAVNEPSVAPILFDLAAIRSKGEIPAVFRGLIRPGKRAARGQQRVNGGLAAKLAGLGKDERRILLEDLVRGRIAGVLGHDSGASIKPQRALQDLGLDSLAAVELRNQLGADTGLKLPATLAFDHPSAAAIADYLLAELGVGTDRPVQTTQVRAVAGDPIAVVGMSCRYPGGVNSPEDLWHLVTHGVDAVSEFPPDRGWDVGRLYHPDREHPGTSYTRNGGFLLQAAEFDADFFGISPREAVTTDVQQRLLLEVTWEALERAGVDPSSLRGSRTGVFTGVMYNDYAMLLEGPEFDGFRGNGSAASIASGRVAYALGLEGPAVTIDTACSSSLVAVHLAAQALRTGEATIAVAGGVTVMSTPGAFLEFSRQGGLSEDGRCKAYGDGADGVGWSEGVGMLVLERLSDAQRNGHRILAVLKGSAVNSDGASNGLTAPNGPSQQRVIHQALSAAGLSTSDVDAVEGHGTGTPLGDPIEAQALLATYGQDRPEGRPLLLGSIKSNLGHTQAAAGVAGMIKMIQAMDHGVLPRTLHADTASTKVDWTAGEVELLTEQVSWPEVSRPRRVGVSSFGISGTNAHVILEQPPTKPSRAKEILAHKVPWLVSAQSAPALDAAIDQTRVLDGNPADIAYSLATTRALFDHRAVLLDGVELARGVATEDGRTAYVFSGQGSQRLGMGRELHARFPVFAEALDAAIAEFAQLVRPVGQSGRTSLPKWDELRSVMWGEDAAALNDTRWAQPALFALEVATYRLVESWGQRPDFLVGHSIGEIAAAHVSGILSLSDACTLVGARARLMADLPVGGVMIAVQAPESEVRPLLTDQVAIAAINRPDSVVLSGAADAVTALADRLAEQGHRTRKLAVSHAFHSPLMDPMLAEFTAALDGISFGEATIPIISTLTGKLAEAEELRTPGYWAEQVRGCVRFADAVATLGELGVRAVLELGPDGQLSAAASDVLPTGSVAAPVLRPDTDEEEAVLRGLAALHVGGARIDWTTLLAGGSVVDLPTYPFQHRRYWPAPGPGRGEATALGLEVTRHPLLAASTGLAATGEVLLSGRLSPVAHPWLPDHQVNGRILFPGAGFVELAFRAGDLVGCDLVEELTMAAALPVPADGAVNLQVVVGAPDDRGNRPITIHSRPADTEDEPWTRHASGLLAPAPTTDATDFDTAVWPPEGSHPVDLTDCYEEFARRGFAYGPAFQGLTALWQRGTELFAEVTLAEDSQAGYGLHPALLDATLHALIAAGEGGRPRLPFSWERVRLHASGAQQLRARLAPSVHNPDAVTIHAVDTDGLPVVTVEALLTREADPAEAVNLGDSLFTLDWTPISVNTAPQQENSTTVVEFTGTAGELPGSALTLTTEALTLLQQHSAAAEPLIILTRGATTGEDPAAAAVWGLVRSAQSEHPGLFRLIDLDQADTPPAAALTSDEPQLVVRGTDILAGRLTRAPKPEPRPIGWDGTVLVTGGVDGLGRLIARRLADTHGIRSLVLASRRGPDTPGAAELLGELTELGATARLVACDVADRTAITALVNEIADLTAVVHCAGVLDDGVIDSLTPDRLAKALGAKANAAWHLHEATKDRDLTAFVLFSSLAGTMGAAGQGNYAAANAFVDALARHRQHNGLPATALGWGGWAPETGMTARLSTTERDRLEQTGLPLLPVDQALGLFDAALTRDEPVLLPFRLNLAALRAQDQLPPVLHHLVTPRRNNRRTAKASATATGLIERLGKLSPADRHEVLEEMVRTRVAAVLAHDGAHLIDPDRSFAELGFDSLTAVELRNQLTAELGLRLPATLVFDYPSATVLTRHLLDELLGAADAPATKTRTTAANDEPIAIVGIGCRFPGGVNSPEDLWKLLSAGRDATSDFPRDRGWDLDSLIGQEAGAAGASITGRGGFMADVAGFDAEFFGMSPREALATDAQHRLLLEASWEALERAGIDPAALRGSDTGVFAGIMYADYGSMLTADEFEGFRGSGNAPSVASGRISYILGLEGPAVTVDTACSSSLVALHWAAQALRAGECSLVLAGGATVLATPGAFVEFTRQNGLAPDGRCKSYSDNADGVAWAEGVGMLVLERLSDAQRNGRQILAVVKGSAINSDGASNGLTAPNGPSQQRVIRQALASAGLSTSDVDAVEGHGTGTTLGDPIEAQALLATYGQDRDTPLLLGSVKSNLGHTQAAAGVAGVIKMVLALQHGELPPTVNLDTPSTEVDWTEGQIELLAETTPWPAVDRPRRGAVSSFGISGTNAHVVLEQAPDRPVGKRAETGVVPWLLSARGEHALRAQAGRLLAQLRTGEINPADLGFSLATGRSAFRHRAAVLADPADLSTARAALTALAEGKTDPALVLGSPAGGRTAFVFSGQGSQRLGMGRDLHARFPAFAEAFDAVLAEFAQLVRPVGPSGRTSLPKWDDLREVIWGEDAAALNDTRWTQPALFAFEVALFRLFESWGARPDYLAGHSIGELAAAHVSGAVSLSDACTLVSARARLMANLPVGGVMIAVRATEAEVLPLLTDQVSIAAVNAPGSLVLAGAEDAVLAIAETLAAQGRDTKRLTVSHAFHSPLMEPMLAEFAAAIDGITVSEPTIPLVSALTGTRVCAEELGDPDFWVRHVRQTVRFADTMAALREAGSQVFLELGPRAGLKSALLENLEEGGEQAGLVVATGGADLDEVTASLTALSALHCWGRTVRWPELFPGANLVDLPTYAFQHERYWPQASQAPTNRSGEVRAFGLAESAHPLLGAVAEFADGRGALFASRLSLRTQPWLADHAVLGRVLFPGTGLAELASWAGNRIGCGRLVDLTLSAPLLLPAEGAVQVQVRVGEASEAGEREVTIHSRPEGEDEQWTLNASGALDDQLARPAELTEAWPPAGAEAVDLTGCYDALTDAGFGYGPAFRGLRALWRHEQELYAEVALHADFADQATSFGLHPALLDSALHAAMVAAAGTGEAAVPHTWEGVTVHRTGANALRVKLTRTEQGLTLIASDVDGRLVATVDTLRVRPVSTEQLAAADRAQDTLFHLAWTPAHTTALLPDWAEITSLDELDSPPPLVLLRCNATGGDLAAAAHDRLGATLAVVQRWLAEERFAASRLVLVTRKAIGAEPEDVGGAAIWGLIRSAQHEQPGRFGLLDLDQDDIPEAALALLEEEPQVLVRGSRTLAARLHRLPVQQDTGTKWDPDRTVVITGGTGGLGKVVARHLVTRHGIRHLLLLSRSGASATGATEFAAELATHGATAELRACDVGDREAIAAALAAVPAEHAIQAVVHAAGVLDDGVITGLTPDALTPVLRPKVDAAWHLHELTQHLDLTAFVLFSSVAGVFGNGGQASYAAANSFIDALAQHRRAQGLPATSIAWGPWSLDDGMVSTAEAARMRRLGVLPLSAEEGMALFDGLPSGPEAVPVPLRLDLASIRSSGQVPPLLRALVRTPDQRGAIGDPAADFLAKLAEAPVTQRHEVVVDLVRDQAAAVLGHADPSAVARDRRFQELGFDSLTTVELRNRLGAALGRRLPVSLLFDHPTPEVLADYLLPLLAPAETDPATEVLRQLDKLGAELAALATDDGIRQQISGKLDLLLAGWSAKSGSDNGEVDFAAATDEELFDLLDNEWEKP
ncbi:SDR family NAD(P)-dependent oxidoreductase [Crossiella sp. CA198]|uniref:SDR family NAD(P)-dependent oxidoreductase n=1 Tax=Crossiella sp. CA198 TaxID=3455607 RepID=UPI003F8D8C6A